MHTQNATQMQARAALEKEVSTLHKELERALKETEKLHTERERDRTEQRAHIDEYSHDLAHAKKETDDARADAAVEIQRLRQEAVAARQETLGLHAQLAQVPLCVCVCVCVCVCARARACMCDYASLLILYARVHV